MKQQTSERLSRVWSMGQVVMSTVVRRLPFVFRGRRARRWAVLAACAALVVGLGTARPFCLIGPGETGIRVNLLTGHATELHEGWGFLWPQIHRLQRISLLDQSYRTVDGLRSDSPAPFQSSEGLSLGIDATVRYALEPAQVAKLGQAYGSNIEHDLVAPLIDGVLRRTLARHTVREIFATQRAEIQASLETELRSLLEGQGVAIRSVLLGNVDLPAQYRTGVEALLAEEMSAEKMRFTLELKEKQVKESELEAEALKVRQEKAAEAAAAQDVISAKGREEAMKHILPFKEKEIEQKRLEAEAAKVSRMKIAEGEAEARRIEAGGEADARRTLAESEAYRMEVTGKAQSAQLARDAELISRNPLHIQKTLADKLSDKIQVIIAPPSAGGFFASGLLGAPAKAAPPSATQTASSEGATPADDSP